MTAGKKEKHAEVTVGQRQEKVRHGEVTVFNARKDSEASRSDCRSTPGKIERQGEVTVGQPQER